MRSGPCVAGVKNEEVLHALRVLANDQDADVRQEATDWLDRWHST